MSKGRCEGFWHAAAILAPSLAALVIGTVFLLRRGNPLPLAVCAALTGLFAALLSFVFERRARLRLDRERELLRHSEESYALASSLSSEVLFRYDCAGRSLSFNRRPAPGGWLVPLPSSYDALVAGADFAAGENRDALLALERAVREGACRGTAEFCLTGRGGSPLWQRVDYRVLRDAGGAPFEVVGKLTDVTEQKRLLGELLQRAESDSLTNLLNRGAMADRTEAFLTGEGKMGLHAFFMIDVDDFKKANDTLGHSMGDRLLVAFAAQVLGLFRKDDLVCRMGGDEFSVLLKDIRDRSQAEAKAREICACLEAVNQALRSAVTASVGAALYPSDGDGFTSLYEKADRALYQAKRLGKNRVAFFSEDAERPGNPPHREV